MDPQQGASSSTKSPLRTLAAKFRISLQPAAAAARSTGPTPAPTHLVVMANGLFGAPGNWSTILSILKKRTDANQVGP